MTSIRYLAAFSLLASAPLLAAPVTYVIDPQHSFPNFSVNHLEMSTIRGRFDRMSGKVVFDAAAKAGSVDVKIATVSVTTGDPPRGDGKRTRDEHLRSADFFNSAEFPDMLFKSTKFNFAGERLESIEGALTLLGVAKPVKLQVTHFKCGPHPFTKKAMCGADAEATIKRTDFGMKAFVPAVSDEVRIQLGIEAYAE